MGDRLGDAPATLEVPPGPAGPRPVGPPSCSEALMPVIRIVRRPAPPVARRLFPLLADMRVVKPEPRRPGFTSSI